MQKLIDIIGETLFGIVAILVLLAILFLPFKVHELIEEVQSLKSTIIKIDKRNNKRYYTL